MMGDSALAWVWISVLVVGGICYGVYRIHEQGTSWLVIGLVGALLCLLLAALAWVVWKAWPNETPEKLLRDRKQIPDMLGKKAAERGVGLRASIESAKGVSMRELAPLIGRLKGKSVYASYEDFTIVMMGPRSNKTSAVAVPRILSAPGAVIATSNKPDLWILTGALRKDVGPVYVFDPSQIAYAAQTWWWNILSGITTLRDAKKVAEHFIEENRGGGSGQNEDPFFAPTGKNLLSWALLAASLSGRTMRDVLDWIDTYSDKPIDILHQHGNRRAANAFAAVLDLPAETRGGVFGEAQTALASIQDEETLRWITPPNTWEQPTTEKITELDLWSLFAYEDGKAPTLYLMTQEGSGSAGAVIAAMVAKIFELGDLAASAHGGRVDPPLTLVLDECANICKIKRLPKLASHLGSKSMCVTAIFQSEAQVISTWGADDAAALWGASTVRILGAGLQDEPFLRKISGLVGQYKPRERRRSHGPGGVTTSNDRGSLEPIMPVEEIAAMKKRNALLIRQESRPVLIDLIPWYTEPDKGDVERVRDEATKEVQNAAIEHLGPANPVAKALRRRLDEQAKASAA
ncbi:type IV secretory system conjugative DNA transfer family protein [Nocardia farcinica]|nr:type IV secretory system conjugative DNA transfer family protein [Nocardia farcinica]MBF6265458.1 type IV secretory system conjugative DNA transfer family protein [Nocardia farcinica]MBF6271119.1 type IV secretory system conjugative DNA transfer family protein [Nocardia farcinica]MBF6284058.1 type IV secretory system conjugative DNA transfer family protein [Nocardia farcinica]MBF6308090.1 type IV secretory system conjugative DNA transfer family protein [Nocardia farcinica]